MEYISIPREKIQALAGFAPLPVKAKISKAHTLPFELAGPGKQKYIIVCVIMLKLTKSQ